MYDYSKIYSVLPLTSLSPVTSVLVARANEWLQDNTLAGLVVVKCETVERQMCCVAELTADMTTTFRPTTARPCFVTGLR